MRDIIIGSAKDKMGNKVGAISVNKRHYRMIRIYALFRHEDKNGELKTRLKDAITNKR